MTDITGMNDEMECLQALYQSRPEMFWSKALEGKPQGRIYEDVKTVLDGETDISVATLRRFISELDTGWRCISCGHVLFVDGADAVGDVCSFCAVEPTSEYADYSLYYCIETDTKKDGSVKYVVTRRYDSAVIEEFDTPEAAQEYIA